MIGRLFGARIEAPPYCRDALPDGAVLRAGRWIPRLGGWLAGARGPASAVTLGRTIVVHPDAALTRRLIRHEAEHVRQWRRRPLSFPLHYTWLYLKHGYRANPYEVAARAAETEDRGEPARGFPLQEE
jgi:hypothetical protein